MSERVKSVVITVAGKGFGKAGAAVFSAAGREVLPLVRTGADARKLEASHGERCRPLIADLTGDVLPGRLRAHVPASGKLDVLINNAGLPATGAHLTDVDAGSIGHLIMIHDGTSPLRPRGQAAGLPRCSAGSTLRISAQSVGKGC